MEARGGAGPEAASEVSDALLAQLVADGRLQVVERQQIARVMKEQALSQSGVMSDAAQIRVAQLVGARTIAVGALQQSGKGFMLALRAIDAESAQVVFADTLRVGSADQLEAGARQLGRKLADALAGPSTSAGPAPVEVGDFDVAEVKDEARSLASSLAMRFPKVTGKVADALPDGSVSCSFPSGQPFAGQFFEITGRDDVTEQEVRKGFFLLRRLSPQGCSGRAKREPGQDIGRGDTLTALPLKIDLQPLEPGAGTQPQLAKLLTNELRAALDQVPDFKVTGDAQLSVRGRVSGPRGSRTVALQVVDKGGEVLQKLELPGNF